MSKTILEPIIVSNDVIVQFTKTVNVDKKLLITVPSSYKAVMFIDEEPLIRIDECNNESVFKKLGKDKSYLNKKLKIAFFRINSFPAMEWGFGLINVKNAEETYVLGANGEIQVSIEDKVKFVKKFGSVKNITLDDISAKVKGYIKNVGTGLFGEYFNSKEIKFAEAERHLNSLRDKLKNELENEIIFKDLGLKIENLNIRNLSKSDLENIKEIKPEITADEFNSLKKEIKTKFEDINDRLNSSIDIDLLKKEIMDRVEELTKDNITQDDLDELKESIETRLEDIDLDEDDSDDVNKIDELIKDVEERLNVSLNSKIDSIKQIIDNALEEKEVNKLELYEKAKDEYINNLKLTTDILIEKAETDEDLAAPAGVIYSNVELNLTKHPDLNHVGNIFTAAQDKYYEVAKKIMVKDLNLLNSFNKRVYETKDGIDYIEVPTEFRFIIYGLSVEDAFQAAKDWTLLNKCRHLSIENKEKLERALKDRGITRKEFLKYILEFYRRVNLFTKD